jgi:hypothetical protein
MSRLGSAIAVFALATVVPSAQATLQLAYQINGGPVTVCATGPNTFVVSQWSTRAA